MGCGSSSSQPPKRGPFIMARFRQRPIKPSRISKMTTLSFELLCVSFQALNLPTSGSRIRLLQTLSLASNPVRPQGRISSGRVTKFSRLISSSRARKRARRCANDKFTDQSPLTLIQNSLKPPKRLSTPGLSVHEPFENRVAFIENTDVMLTPDQLSLMQAANTRPVKVPLSTLNRHDGQLVSAINPRTQSHRARSSVITLLGVNRPLHISPEEEEEERFCETRAHSQVTVAAQQRAEAAYRRQRMAQEREQTAVLRAELEVERARMLKEMTGGSRRPSYCLELEDPKEEAPDEVRENLDKCLQDYFVEEKNAKNSHFNGYSRSAEVINSESRGESVEAQNIQERLQADDENGNTERKSSIGEHNDKDYPEKQDLLQAIARSAQASPSNVCIEENEATRDHLPNGDETLGQIAEITVESRESHKSQDVPITENADVSQDQTVEKPAKNDMETIVNEDSSMAQENITNNDKSPQEIKTEHNSAGLEQVQDTTNNVNSDLNEPIKITDNLNGEPILSSHGSGTSVKENKQQQNGIELNKNIDYGSGQTQQVDLSTDQDTESLKREKGDTELQVDESSVTQQVT